MTEVLAYNRNQLAERIFNQQQAHYDDTVEGSDHRNSDYGDDAFLAPRKPDGWDKDDNDSKQERGSSGALKDMLDQSEQDEPGPGSPFWGQAGTEPPASPPQTTSPLPSFSPPQAVAAGGAPETTAPPATETMATRLLDFFGAAANGVNPFGHKNKTDDQPTHTVIERPDFGDNAEAANRLWDEMMADIQNDADTAAPDAKNEVDADTVQAFTAFVQAKQSIVKHGSTIDWLNGGADGGAARRILLDTAFGDMQQTITQQARDRRSRAPGTEALGFSHFSVAPDTRKIEGLEGAKVHLTWATDQTITAGLTTQNAAPPRADLANDPSLLELKTVEQCQDREAALEQQLKELRERKMELEGGSRTVSVSSDSNSSSNDTQESGDSTRNRFYHPGRKIKPDIKRPSDKVSESQGSSSSEAELAKSDPIAVGADDPKYSISDEIEMLEREKARVQQWSDSLSSQTILLQTRTNDDGSVTTDLGDTLLEAGQGSPRALETSPLAADASSASSTGASDTSESSPSDSKASQDDEGDEQDE